ncbi:hypothetical protein JYU34_010399 [Plutella xylostella]|uniref:PHD-type domain-containing protein n=1 Tax=Plutella xylostella TaxID=51655 RepID=A0ABQ7QIF6_PLUXY|nr:hypothetical protein JYU34_010399 [Plutella xylostella]
MAKCSTCSTLVNKNNPGLQCSKCKKWIHGKCASLSAEQLNVLFLTKSVEWQCKTCVGKTKPTRLSCILPDNEEEETYEAEETGTDRDTKMMLQEIKNEVQTTIRRELKREIQTVIREELQRSLQFFSDKIDDYEKTQKETTEKIATMDKQLHNLTNTCSYLQKYSGALEQKIIDLEQNERQLNLEIVGLEELPNEEPMAIVKKLGELMKVSTTEIECARRTSPKTNAKSSPILVRFLSSGGSTRETWLKQRRELRLITSNLVTGGPSTGNIYINEDLVPEMRELFWKARTELRDQFKYIWVRGGKILVKKNDGAKTARIKNMSDVSELKSKNG